MEGATKELREQSEKGQDETEVALENVTLADRKDDPSIPIDMDPGEDETEPPADWLEPLEDCEDDGDEAVETDRSSQQRSRKSNNGKNVSRKRGRPSVSSSCAWMDCPEVGRGWKRKVIIWRAGKSATYYMSPKGVRIRSKVQLAKHLKTDLTLFDYKGGKFLDAVIPRKRRKARAKEGRRRSLSPSRAVTPDLDTSENLTMPLQNGPITPIPPSTSPPLKSSYRSPAEFTPVSPTIPQQPSPSPSLKLDDLSVQTNSASPSWLQSSLAPVSPIKTPETDFPTYSNDQSAMKDSPYLNPTPLTQLALDPEGGLHDRGLPPLEGCANCGCTYPGMGSGKQLLCPKCRPRRNEHPHIVFKKVGQDRWILGSSKNDISLKKMSSPLGKRHLHPTKSLRLQAQREKAVIKTEGQLDTEEDDDGLDDGPDGAPDDEGEEYGPRKRKRRMCGWCKACLRNENCGKCDFCLDKTRYGGPNKLRQKCRFRQCQVRSRLQTGSLKYARAVGVIDSGQGESSPRKHSKHWGRRKMKRRSRSSRHYMDDETYYEGRRLDRNGRKGKPRKYSLRLRRAKDEDKVSDPEMEDGGLGDLEQDPFLVCDDGSSGFYESEELYSNNYIQNGTDIDMVQNSGQHPVEVEYSELPRGPELVYTVPGLPDGSQLLSPVLTNSIPLQLSAVPGTHTPLMLDVPAKAAPQQHTEVLNSNGASLRLSDFLRNHGLELVEVDTTLPQILPAPNTAYANHEPGTLDTSPETCSLPDSSDSSSVRDAGLLELLTSLRRTILPAHWVGVMANGPFLQLFQCSKLSPMADTVLQIEPDYLYQISVQNQPLLPTHAVYERHPDRLTGVSQVVSLLLDLEEMNVCQGYQSFEANSQREPLLCARAALCQLLVPQDEDCCDKCQECTQS